MFDLTDVCWLRLCVCFVCRKGVFVLCVVCFDSLLVFVLLFRTSLQNTKPRVGHLFFTFFVCVCTPSFGLCTCVYVCVWWGFCCPLGLRSGAPNCF